MCEVCNDTGWAPAVNASGVERVARCACWLARQRSWAEGVPVEFQGATLENYRAMTGNRTALKIATAFLDGTRDLLLVGQVGAGKTRLACSVLNALHTAKGLGWFVRVPLMLHKLQPTGDRDEDGDARRLEARLMAAPVLCLDDLGAERDRASDYTRRTLLMIYEARHDAGVRTIWTSNKSVDDLAAMQDDDRLASRLAGWADVVALECADQRMAS